ncbi:hypothetical protein AB0I81_04450 [Nonomuraea sp. NPDC050404]|uniref:hypothetical protein n=1 Tax=Nonomuraea sp. NPDC050404 TaxID=3155783 RepID=UPI0033D8E249
MISFVAVIAIGGGGMLVWRLSGGGSGEAAAGEADASSLEALKKGSLTDGDLAKVDPAALFYASFKALTTQPVMHITMSSYQEKAEFDKNTPKYVWESGYDYRTKKWQLAWGSGDDDDGPVSYCDDNESHLYSFMSKKWLPVSRDDTMCAQKSAYRYITDGVSAGGLTAEQAEVWIRELRTEYEGLVNPGRVQPAEIDGRKYLRLVVDIKPTKRAGGLYIGGQSLMWSFKKTGLDPQAHPYSYTGGMGTGFHIEYLIDPKSLLPAYAEIELTPMLGEDGKPRLENFDFSGWRVQYHLPGKMPELRTARPERPALDWPGTGN